MAVLLATLGVIVVVYGGSTSSQLADLSSTEVFGSVAPKATSPLIGNLLTLLASVIYGLYQVLYKKHVALPSDPELVSDLYDPIPAVEEDPEEMVAPSKEAVYQPPSGLYPNLLTSLIGLLTLLLLWVPIPLLHYFSVELFSLPTNALTYLTITGIVLSGVLFNAGFMV